MFPWLDAGGGDQHQTVVGSEPVSVLLFHRVNHRTSLWQFVAFHVDADHVNGSWCVGCEQVMVELHRQSSRGFSIRVQHVGADLAFGTCG